MNRYPPDTIALLGADTLAEDILAQLLQEEGYNTKVHEANATEAMDRLLDGVDVLLLAAARYDGLREAFLGDMGNTPRIASIPHIQISRSLKQALLDQPDASVPWPFGRSELPR